MLPPEFITYWQDRKTALAALRVSTIALRDAALDIQDYATAATHQLALDAIVEEQRALSLLASTMQKRNV